MKRRTPSPPELELGDRALAERILAGDSAAFEEFFDGFFPALYRFALARLRNPDLTRDIVQSALVKAVAHLDTYRGEASLAAWLFTICRHEISGHYRSKGRAPEPVELAEESPEIRAAVDSMPGSPGDPASDLEQKEVSRLVHATLDRLPPRYGQALEWKYLDGLPVKEIARRLDVGPKAAESLLTRARQAFREGFSSFGKSFDLLRVAKAQRQLQPREAQP